MPVNQIDQVFAFGRIQLTAAAMGICLQREIPIFLFSGQGRYQGMLSPPARGTFELHQAQLELLNDGKRKLAFARAVVEGKIANSLELLEQYRRNHPEADLDKPLLELRAALKHLPHARELNVVRGVEGNAAAAYFRGFGACLRGGIRFSQRSRRPPLDPANSMLSFGYTLLMYNVYAFLLAWGLDPAIGLFHEPGHNHPALASDLMEEFRAPLVDALVLALANRGEMTPEDFYLGPGQPQPCLMKDPGRIRYIHGLEGKLAGRLHHPDAPGEVDWRRVLDLQVCRFRRFLEGQTDRYQPWMRRHSSALTVAHVPAQPGAEAISREETNLQ